MNNGLKIILIIILAYVAFSCAGLNDSNENVGLGIIYIIVGFLSTIGCVILIVSIVNPNDKKKTP